MLVLAEQEKKALAAMSLVIIICICGTVLLESLGKERYATTYYHGLADETLVNLSGTVSKVTTITGGHIILEVSGVSVFIPVSTGQIPKVAEGDNVCIIGTVQHYKGKEEVIVDDYKDIRIFSGYPRKDQHSGQSGSEFQD